MPTLGKDESSIATMIKVNQIYGVITIMVVIYTTVMILDGIVNRKFDHDINGINRESFLFKQFKRMNIKLQT
jgi:Piezo non-specific cation channel, R-Ras-binding domain